MLADLEGWKAFWRFNSGRGADLGSLWLVARTAATRSRAHTVNVVSWVVFVAVCLGCWCSGWGSTHPPRVAQLAFLVLVGFLLVNKVYSPQYVLWLLPVAVLARPRWRDLLIWQAGELFYFAMVWMYLGSFTASATSGAQDSRTPSRSWSASPPSCTSRRSWSATCCGPGTTRPARHLDDDPMCAEPGEMATPGATG